MTACSTTKAKCPRCGRIYVCKGEPTKNPGGMGAKDGWTCVFCVVDPPYRTRVKFAQLWSLPSWASVWMPVYLEPYEGPEPADFEQFEVEPYAFPS